MSTPITAARGERVQIWVDPLTEHTPECEAEVVTRTRAVPGRYLRVRPNGKTWGQLGIYVVRLKPDSEEPVTAQRVIFEPFAD